MAPDERRARRAYEWGRLKYAARRMWLPAVLVVCAEQACGCTAVSYGVVAALALTTLFLGWRGGWYERAIAPATVGGCIAFLAPLCAAYAGVRDEALVATCGFGGVLAGALLAVWGVRQQVPLKRVFAVAAFHIVLVGALGCAIVGVGAFLGLALGVFVAAAPAWVRAPAAA